MNTSRSSLFSPDILAGKLLSLTESRELTPQESSDLIVLVDRHPAFWSPLHAGVTCSYIEPLGEVKFAYTDGTITLHSALAFKVTIAGSQRKELILADPTQMAKLVDLSPNQPRVRSLFKTKAAPRFTGEVINLYREVVFGALRIGNFPVITSSKLDEYSHYYRSSDTKTLLSLYFEKGKRYMSKKALKETYPVVYKALMTEQLFADAVPEGDDKQYVIINDVISEQDNNGKTAIKVTVKFSVVLTEKTRKLVTCKIDATECIPTLYAKSMFDLLTERLNFVTTIEETRVEPDPEPEIPDHLTRQQNRDLIDISMLMARASTGAPTYESVEMFQDVIRTTPELLIPIHHRPHADIAQELLSFYYSHFADIEVTPFHRNVFLRLELAIADPNKLLYLSYAGGKVEIITLQQHYQQHPSTKGPM